MIVKSYCSNYRDIDITISNLSLISDKYESGICTFHIQLNHRTLIKTFESAEYSEELASTPYAKQDTQLIIENSRNCHMPSHHEVRAEDVDLKRLGAVLVTAYESQPKDFESLLLTKNLGPRTLQSLALVSEVIHGTPSRFRDPARFSFAHGGKDGHPFPVPLKIYDESIRILGDSIEKSKLGYKDKSECLKRLHKTAMQIEKNCSPQANFDQTIAHEKEHSLEWGGRTVAD